MRRKTWQLKDYKQNTVLFSNEVALVLEGVMGMTVPFISSSHQRASEKSLERYGCNSLGRVAPL